MKLVLDTNVVLDWLVFEVPALELLREGVRDGKVAVATNAQAVEELRRVLVYPQFKLEADAPQAVLRDYLSQTSSPDQDAVDPAALPEKFPRCHDPDDDKFLALAYHAKADLLVSKDKAVLKLRRRAPAFGFRIVNVPELIAELAARAHTTASASPMISR